MRKFSTAAPAVIGGFLAFSTASHATPLVAGTALTSESTRSTIDANAGNEVTDVQYRHRHRGWRHNRWHRPRVVYPRYGYRYWAPRPPRYYAPRRLPYYGYAPYRPYRYY